MESQTARPHHKGAAAVRVTLRRRLGRMQNQQRFADRTVVASARPSASTVTLGARSDIGPDMERISLSSLLPVAVTGPQPSGPTAGRRGPNCDGFKQATLHLRLPPGPRSQATPPQASGSVLTLRLGYYDKLG
jgi:hypothetical protein